MDGFVIKKNTVMLLAVFAERLTVVRHNSDQAAVEKISLPQLRQQPSDNRVGVSDLPVVRGRPVSRLVWLWRRIGIVRIVKMNPKKKGPGWMFVEPGHGTTQDLFPAPLQAVIVVFPRVSPVKSGVVMIETAVKTGRQFCRV